MFEGKNSLHYYEEGGDANKELSKQIDKSVKEATKNFDASEE